MPKVYIVNDSTHNYDIAKKYGSLVHVTKGKVPIFKTDEVSKALLKSLRKFEAQDYLLVAGPAWLSIMSSIALFSRYNEVKFLIFDAKAQEYIVRHLNRSTLIL